MSRFARVTSIDVLQTTAGALQKFRSDAAVALDDLDANLRRALDWIHHDRKEYWAHELRRGSERLSEARIQLQQARAVRRLDNHEAACVDEQRAVDRAKRRIELVEEKIRAVQRWNYNIDHAVEEFQRNRAQFATWLDIDLPKAIAALQRMGESLGNYVSLEKPREMVEPIVPAQDAAPQKETPKDAEP
jgi:chromosome segregation ATPase